MAQPPPPPPPYAEEVVVEERPPVKPPRSSIWPWLLALLIAAAGIVAVAWALTQDQGPETNDVPAVVGLPRERAESRLRAAGFPAVVEFKASTQAEGIVLLQQPEPGAALERGSRVGITLSSGRPQVRVPTLVGLSARAATRLLRSLTLSPNASVVPSDEPAGRVLAQNPPAGETVARNTEVFFTVSRGPRLVAVPAVRGLTRARAVARLQDAGLVARIREVPSPEEPGTVVAQEPPREQRVRRGSTVTLNVSSGPGLVAVPAVVGLTEERAVATLADAGLVPVVVPVQSPEPVGVVVAQNPPRDAEVEAGARVRINVSRPAEETATTTTATTG